MVCLYSVTEGTRDRICQINVEGPSPVGFRSLIGNYFFSTEYTIWHRARKFIVYVVLLPMPFLASAIFVECLFYQKILPDKNILTCGLTFRPFRILCHGCYICNAFYFHILGVISTDAELSHACMDNGFHDWLMGIQLFSLRTSTANAGVFPHRRLCYISHLSILLAWQSWSLGLLILGEVILQPPSDLSLLLCCLQLFSQY